MAKATKARRAPKNPGPSNVVQLHRPKTGALVLWEQQRTEPPQWKARVFVGGREIGYALGTRSQCNTGIPLLLEEVPGG